MVSCCEAKDDEFNEFCNIDFQPQTRVSTLKPTSCYRPTRKLQQVRCPSSRHRDALLVPTVHQADISLSVKPISVCPSSRYYDALLVPTVHQADIRMPCLSPLSMKPTSGCPACPHCPSSRHQDALLVPMHCPSSRHQSVRQVDISLSVKSISWCTACSHCPSSRCQSVRQADISLSVKPISVCPSSRYQSVHQADISLSVKPISWCIRTSCSHLFDKSRTSC